MPIYTYRCENCGVQFDRQQSYSDQSLTRCPECNKNALRKVYLPVGIVFKGSGFYSTDHRSPSGTGRTPAKEKAGEDRKAADTSSESSTDSKTKTDEE